MTTTIIQADARHLPLSDQSVNCCVTSPPYFGLRDYGTAKWEGGSAECQHRVGNQVADTKAPSSIVRGVRPGVDASRCLNCGATRIDAQIGLEPTPAAYVEEMVKVFREVRRVLRDDGTCWINLGSSYASANTNPTRSRRSARVPACGIGGIELGGSQSADRVYLDSCDELQGEKPTRPLGIVHNDQPTRPDACESLLKGRDNERLDSFALPRSASHPSVLESTTQRFSSPLLDVSCQEATVSACRAETPTIGRNSLESVGSSACTSGTFQKPPPLVSRTVGKESFYSACHRSDCKGVGRCGYCWCSLSIPFLNIKSKDMVPIPWMVAMALQADGWYLRQDIIWAKPNPMPESVTDRCTKAHEYIFLLSKSAKYYYDAQAIQEDATSKAGGRSFGKQHGIAAARGARAQSRRYDRPIYTKRNRRSVWTVATRSYKGAHFATFPPKLIEPCILAGSLIGGTVLDPFAGSGTTLRVAADNGRNAIGIELNPDYIALAHKRLAEVATKKPTRTRRRMAEVQLRLLG